MKLIILIRKKHKFHYQSSTKQRFSERLEKNTGVLSYKVFFTKKPLLKSGIQKYFNPCLLDLPKNLLHQLHLFSFTCQQPVETIPLIYPED